MKESIYLIIYSLALLWCIALSSRKWAKIDKQGFEKKKHMRYFITGFTVVAFVCGVIGRIQVIELLGIPNVLELFVYIAAPLALGAGFALIIIITIRK